MSYGNRFNAEVIAQMRQKSRENATPEGAKALREQTQKQVEEDIDNRMLGKTGFRSTLTGGEYSGV